MIEVNRDGEVWVFAEQEAAKLSEVPLELLDLVIDPHGQRLTGNPAHGGEHVFEMY